MKMFGKSKVKGKVSLEYYKKKSICIQVSQENISISKKI